MPKLSVIIPVHNGKPSLRRCIDSILSQSFKDLEIICVDDNSNDGSNDILQEYANRDSRVHVTIFQRHLGMVIARKMALLDAQGEYVMFVDADDWLLPGACETAVGLIKEFHTDIVQFSVDFEARQEDADALDMFTRIFRSREMESHGTNILYDCFVNHRFMHNLWNKIYRAKICKEAIRAMPDIQLHHYTDLYLSFFLLFFADSFRSVITKPCYRYHYGGGVSTKSPDNEQFKDLCEVNRVLPLMEKFLRDHNAYETNVSILDAIHNTLRQDIVNKLLTIPSLTREIISIALEYWGGDVIFDFMSKLGMFKYPIENRMSIISDLIEQYEVNRKEIARLQSELDIALNQIQKHSPQSFQQIGDLPRDTSQPSCSSSPEFPSTLQQEIISTPQRIQFRFVQKLPKI